MQVSSPAPVASDQIPNAVALHARRGQHGSSPYARSVRQPMLATHNLCKGNSRAQCTSLEVQRGCTTQECGLSLSIIRKTPGSLCGVPSTPRCNPFCINMVPGVAVPCTLATVAPHPRLAPVPWAAERRVRCCVHLSHLPTRQRRPRPQTAPPARKPEQHQAPSAPYPAHVPGSGLLQPFHRLCGKHRWPKVPARHTLGILASLSHKKPCRCSASLACSLQNARATEYRQDRVPFKAPRLVFLVWCKLRTAAHWYSSPRVSVHHDSCDRSPQKPPVVNSFGDLRASQTAVSAPSAAVLLPPPLDMSVWHHLQGSTAGCHQVGSRVM